MISTKLLPTTVVGSYPAVKTGGIRALFNPLAGAQETAVSDQIHAGIDIISDGQVGGDMISLIADYLPGVKGQEIIGKIQPSQRPITLQGVKYALSRHPKVKGIITGPSTIAHGLKIRTPIYRDRTEAVLDIGEALATEARSLASAGVTILQIDEPILSTGAADLHAARQAIGTITSVVRTPTCMHVCGDLTAVIDDLLTFPVDILDFEFSNNPQNHDLFSEKDLKGKKIGYGVVDSASTGVESVAVIQSRIEKGIDIFGPEALFIDPDCGLRMHSRETAYKKLENMVRAAANCRTEL
ncbi:methionine synthase [Methanomicrobiaceae archaeon CYW5]|uniref:methionine synthase n=1 Tax=Methanovulcanius yangii TaxID=1789227 RepID=UPI0029C9FFF3|nr:methionine synthase [Methanovulcanius yangii]MBT8507097.1 methionine synthase [Methanovulcanius yangii]